jgi:hypothetical protein
MLAFGTVTVGAFNNWNYPAVFNYYFSVKSGEPVSFDFSGMGMDIGQTFQCEDYSLKIQSLVADANAVYVSYDIDLSDELDAAIAPYDDAIICGGVTAHIEQADTGENCCHIIHGMNAIRSEDGIYHTMVVVHIDYDMDLSDKQIVLSGEPLSVGYNYTEGRSSDTRSLAGIGEKLTYDFSDIQLREGISVPYGGTLPNDGNENIFEVMDVTPFMLKFTTNTVVGAYEHRPEWRPVFGEAAMDVTYTAIYADGTETPIHLISREGITGESAGLRDDGKYDCQLEWLRYFSVPLSMDGLTAIRINDTVIPVA